MSNSNSRESVYIIIPVYNRKDTTLECLRRLEGFDYLKKYSVIVVDDGSTDGTAIAIKTAYPSVIVLPGNGDLWWTGAMVLGMEHGFKLGAEYFVWLNDDCLVESDTLPKMLDFANSNPNTIVGPGCYYLKDGSWLKKNSGSTGRKRFSGEPGRPIYVEALSGWCVLIPAAVFETIGPPDAHRFPHYDADNMYVLKATRAGFRACVLGDVQLKVLGELGATHPRRSFSNYFRAGLGPKATFDALFWSKKSPYRVPSQFFYHLERYGYAAGALLFLLKVTVWISNWAKFQLISTVKTASISAD